VLFLVFARGLTRALDEGEDKLPAVNLEGITRDAAIRCPKCAWVPQASDRWQCSCEFVWNTFDTQGRCPSCDRRWEDTQCLACHRWSRHVDWYVAGRRSQP
jgi:hypothetical protein